VLVVFSSWWALLVFFLRQVKKVWYAWWAAFPCRVSFLKVSDVGRAEGGGKLFGAAVASSPDGIFP